MIIFLLVVTIGLPIAWLVAEFKVRSSVRRTIGVVTILWSFGVAALAGSLQNFNANVYFIQASKDLLTTSVEQLKAGKTENVIREWSAANNQFEVTYENRARYRQTVD